MEFNAETFSTHRTRPFPPNATAMQRVTQRFKQRIQIYEERSSLLVLSGASLGLLGAFALTRVLGASLSEVGPGKTQLLFGVKALDPITFIVAPILLAVVAILARWISWFGP